MLPPVRPKKFVPMSSFITFLAVCQDDPLRDLVVCVCGNFFTTKHRYVLEKDWVHCGCRKVLRKASVTRLKPVSVQTKPLPKRASPPCSSSIEYRRWSSMKQRCSNPNATGYEHYGGRGIKVCERWLGKDGFKNFLADMGPVPEHYTLDRINNDGDYEPSNCRWATWEAQAASRRNARPELIEHDGDLRTIREWSDEYDWATTPFLKAIEKYGSIAEALKHRVQKDPLSEHR